MTRAALAALGLAMAAVAQESGPAFEPSEVLRVVVFDAATGKPIENAQVLYLHHDDRVQATTAFAAEWQRLLPDLELRLERFGRSTTTDRRGIAFVPRRGLADDIAVRTERLYAQTWGKRLAELDELKAGLVVNPSVDVRVVDRGGKPCPDVEVWVQRGAKFAAPGQCFSAGRTGPDGMRTVRRVGTFALGMELRLVLKLPGLDVPPVLLDPEKPPREPVTLVVPQSLPLRVRITDAAGAPCRDAAVVRVSAVGDAAWRVLERELRPSECGEVVLPYVSPEQRLRVELREPFEAPALEVGGPVPAAAERLATVVLVPPGPVLVGRALDKRGRPLAECRLDGGETHQEPGLGDVRRRFGARTDGEGRFRIFLPREPARLRIDELWLHSDVPGVAARIGPLAVTGAELPLGDLTFAPEPLVVSARLPPDHQVDRRQVRVEAKRDGVWRPCHLDNVHWIDDCNVEFRGRVAAGAELAIAVMVTVRRGAAITGEVRRTTFRVGQKEVQVQL